MSEWKVAFTRPDFTDREEQYVLQALRSGMLAGGGQFTRECHGLLREMTGAASVLLTQSCTAALEMAAILAEVGEGDEVILPSYTFVSTANAFVLRGATPVFVDVEPGTLNLDPAAVRSAVTARTRAIVPVHYAGVACDMERLLDIAREHELLVIEDAAQGVMSQWQGRHLGTIGDLGALSFHNTKNLSSGEGGALLVNNEKLRARAEILWEKGTDRSRFMRGEVDKYSWVDVGSSFLPSEMTAACLKAQLERAREITDRRLGVWQAYDRGLRSHCEQAGVGLPTIPAGVDHNAHMYYIVARDSAHQDAILHGLRERGVQAVFHYIPLHSSAAASKFGVIPATLPVTDDLYCRIVRLPLWSGMRDEDVSYVIECVCELI